MTHLDSKWIDRTDDFYALRDEWQELLRNSASNTLFLTWEWQFTWWQNLAEARKLAILVIRRNGQLIAIAPMTVKPPNIKRMVPFSVLEIIGSGNVGSDYLSFIVRSGAEICALPAINAALLKHNFALELSNTKLDSRVMAMALLGLNDLGFRTGCQTQSFCPYIDLRGKTWQSYMTRTNSAGEIRFNKKLRRLEKKFSFRFEQTSTASDLGEDLATMIKLHFRRWNSKGGSNALDSDALRNFHKAFTGIALQKDWLRLFIMWLDDKPAAAVYGFFYDRVFYYYQAGFDPQFSQYSVGYISIGLTIQRAFDEGASEYDMLHGEEDYKDRWATDKRELVRLNIFPPTPKGRLCERILAFRNQVKKLVNLHAPESIKMRLFASV